MGDLVIINEDEDFVAEQSRKSRKSKGLLKGQAFCNEEGEFFKKNNVKRQPEYKDLILFQIKDGN